MADLTTQQKETLGHTVGTMQSIAAKIAMLPNNQREEQYAVARRSFESAIKKFGFYGDIANKWLDVTIDLLRALVAQIETGRRN